MKLRSIIISPYISLPSDQRASSDRVLILAQKLSETREVIVITTNFDHHKKSFRPSFRSNSLSFKCLPVIPYKENISLARLLSLISFSSYIFFYFIYRFIICAFSFNVESTYFALPFIGTPIIPWLASFSSNKVIIDYQDVWPEAFSLFIKNRKLLKLITFSRNLIWNRLFLKRITALFTVSSRMSAQIKHLYPYIKPKVILIGSKRIFEIPEKLQAIKGTQAIKIFYAGSMGTSYDLKTLCEATLYFNKTSSKKIQLHLYGEYKSNANLYKFYHNSPNIYFHGNLSHNELLKPLLSSYISINPIKASSNASFTNKLSLYFSALTPCISTYYSDEVTEIFSKLGLPLYQAGDYISLANKIEELINMQPDDYYRILNLLYNYSKNNLDITNNYNTILKSF